MENENQTLVPSTAPQIQGANMELMSNPFLLLPNLLLMPLYLFAQLISGMFGTMQSMPANMYPGMPVAPYQSQQSLPPPASEGTAQPQPPSATTIVQTPRTTYTNTEEWELKRDKGGRLEAIIIHRKATEGSEVVDV